MFKAILCLLALLFGTMAYLTQTEPQTANPEAQESGEAAPVPTKENFARWRDVIRPKPEEVRWQEIPWRSSLLEAATEAQRQDKPVLLWAMNGHPLACT